MHAPGVGGGRSLNIDAIGDRVLSQSGRVIARRREDAEIPQVQQPARVPAAVSPAVVVSNIARNQPPGEDMFLQALLNLTSSNGAAAPPSHPRISLGPAPERDPKKLNEARSVEVDTLMKQHAFAKACDFSDAQIKKQVLVGLQQQILGSSETICAICQDTLIGQAFNVARMPCCGGSLHTLCLMRTPYGQRCVFCRADYRNDP